MVLESTMLCVDNSDYMRNGDFIPTRLQSQTDAVYLICHSKTRSNPENNVGLITMANTQVLVTLTSDIGRIHSKLVQVQPSGNISFVTAVRIAHLALKHRQGRNHHMRIVVFVGSPIVDDEKEITKLAKRLRKETVSVDVINFGEDRDNTDKLTTFIDTINGKEGSGSHLVSVPSGTQLSDALKTSPIVGGGGGADQNLSHFDTEIMGGEEDEELALALRVSMEEQRARQQEDVKNAIDKSVADKPTIPSNTFDNDDDALQEALKLSMQVDKESVQQDQPDLDSMTEEEQLAYAQQLSMRMDVESSANPNPGDDYTEVMQDPEFLQSVFEALPGVDPESEVIRNAVQSLTKDGKKDDKEKKEKK